MANRKSRNAILEPVEYHHFFIRGRWLLFDVNALTVLASSPLDRLILVTAMGSLDRKTLVDRLAEAGADRREAIRRVGLLIRHRFLLPPGEKPHHRHASPSHFLCHLHGERLTAVQSHLQLLLRQQRALRLRGEADPPDAGRDGRSDR